MVVVEEYNPKWAKDFSELNNIYLTNIKDVDFAVEHIGSTSVTNLCAKPVIDIAIVHYSVVDFESIKKQLEEIGYSHRGDLGITNREAFSYDGSADLPKHHLYICLDGILALRNQIMFRDYLRGHDEAAIEYSELKKKLAAKYEIDEYCYHKTEFITGILQKCGLSKSEIDEIKSMNEI